MIIYSEKVIERLCVLKMLIVCQMSMQKEALEILLAEII